MRIHKLVIISLLISIGSCGTIKDGAEGVYDDVVGGDTYTTPTDVIAVVDDSKTARAGIGVRVQSIYRSNTSYSTYASATSLFSDIESSRNRYVLIISDNQMPGCGGACVLRRARNLGIPVIIVSAFRDAELKAEGDRLKRLGARAVVPKPSARARSGSEIPEADLHRDQLLMDAISDVLD